MEFSFFSIAFVFSVVLLIILTFLILCGIFSLNLYNAHNQNESTFYEFVKDFLTNEIRIFLIRMGDRDTYLSRSKKEKEKRNMLSLLTFLTFGKSKLSGKVLGPG